MSKRPLGQVPLIEARGEHARTIIETLERAGALVVPIVGPVDLLVGLGGRTYLIQLGDAERLPAAWRGKGGAVTAVGTPLEALAAVGYCQRCGLDSAVPGEGECADCVMERIYGPSTAKQRAAEAAADGG